jgi:hypothetical protein
MDADLLKRDDGSEPVGMDESHDMIGYQWTVYHRHSAHESDGILAAGITDKSDKAKSLVETILTEVDHAAWGLLLRIAMDPWSSFGRPSQTADWPPAGEVQVCRRATSGGFRWGPLFPNDRVEAGNAEE